MFKLLGNLLAKKRRARAGNAAAATLQPYRAITAPEERGAIEQRCLAVAQTYHSLGLSNPFATFRRIVDHLADHSSTVELRPLRRLMLPGDDRRRIVSLRVDMDGDLHTGLRMARYLARVGVPSTFYMLHTASYYGEVRDGAFCRFAGLAAYVRDFVVAGCELGLHTDALSLYVQHRMDGAVAVKTEIEWLRSQGVCLLGTTAHNSAPLYGAENFEIFAKRALADRKELVFEDTVIPLQTLCEKELGLEYEGNFPILPSTPDQEALQRFLVKPPPDAVRTYPWLHSYLVDNPVFRRAYDHSLWLLGNDLWALAQHGRSRALEFPVGTERMLEFIQQAPAGSRTVLVLHPEYVSRA